jgi:hypothetical protein
MTDAATKAIGYVDINLDALWATITQDLPSLLSALPPQAVSEPEAEAGHDNHALSGRRRPDPLVSPPGHAAPPRVNSLVRMHWPIGAVAQLIAPPYSGRKPG